MDQFAANKRKILKEGIWLYGFCYFGGTHMRDEMQCFVGKEETREKRDGKRERRKEK